METLFTFLVPLAIGLAVAFLVPTLVKSKRRLAFLGFVSILGGLSLAVYLNSFPSERTEDYEAVETLIDSVVFEESLDRILVVGSGRDFIIERRLINRHGKLSFEEFSSRLENSQSAVLFVLDGEEVVRGLHSDLVSIPPEAGATEYSDVTAGIWMGVGFAVVGALIVGLAVFTNLTSESSADSD